MLCAFLLFVRRLKNARTDTPFGCRITHGLIKYIAVVAMSIKI